MMPFISYARLIFATLTFSISHYADTFISYCHIDYFDISPLFSLFR